MNENMKNLLAKASEDEKLRAKLEPIAKMEDRDAAGKALLVLAAEAGLPLTTDDLKPEEELNMEELDAVSGGFNAFEEEGCICPCHKYGLGWLAEDWYKEFGYDYYPD